jgi:methionyl-tRNA formyltransferase
MNIVFCGYRDWALNIIEEVKNHELIESYHIINSKEEFDVQIPNLTNKINFIILLGWSWIVSDEITEKHQCIGIHPSDLPSYRGGSPLQHQIIEGVTKSKISLISISKKIDGGDIWLKEDFSLKGDNIKVVFKNLEKSSIRLLNTFFNIKGKVEKQKQNLTLGSYYKRRTPKESRIELNDFSNNSLEEMYNLLRSLTDPYPNAYLEDAEGNKLYFTGVSFKRNTLNE